MKIRFYTNQELSKKLDINLARWKRWSREFLPPDPLGGLQSGYARQYSPEQAFRVYLGGYLVGHLKFTIPEARRILQDLHDWLLAHRFYSGYTRSAQSKTEGRIRIQCYQIAIYSSNAGDDGASGFLCAAMGLIADESTVADGRPVRQQRFVESFIHPGTTATPPTSAASYRVVNISVLHDRFISALESPETGA